MQKNKNLLIITQVVDKEDSNLGFFCEWLEEFANQTDNLYVIANRVGKYDLPKNVTVLSLGKENGVGRAGRLFNFWKYLFKFLPQSQGILAHMCPEYVIYGGFIARLFGKKIGLWYLHKSKNLQLILANILVNQIFTAHKDGYPIETEKLIVTGHGISSIDFSVFTPFPKHINDNYFRMLTVGRITSSKNLLILVKSAIILQKEKQKPVMFKIVGEPYLEEDKTYLKKIKDYITEEKAENFVRFEGKIPHKDINLYYKQADLFLNASKTGGVDKAILEAMASGVPVVTSNSAFKNILPENCFFKEGDVDNLVEKILNYKNIDTEKLRKIVEKEHNLKNTVKKILENIII